MKKEEELYINYFNIEYDSYYINLINNRKSEAASALKYIKDDKFNELSFISKSKENEVELSNFVSLYGTKDIINLGLCDHMGLPYGSFGNAKYKCPLMNSMILKMNQKELTRHIQLYNINNCANDSMCKYNNEKRFINQDSVKKSTTLNTYAKHLTILLLTNIKEFKNKI